MTALGVVMPRAAGAITLLHLFALAVALAWAHNERQARASRGRGWRIGVAVVALGALADVVLFLSSYASGLSALLSALAFIGGGALLVVCLLNGWPSRGLVAVGIVALLTPFTLWALTW